ncbi:MAG: SGNH/GDSL hydrolase family protein [Nitrospira sp.]|nr:SGNH/GDSL hydrolase family protein [Nitrospira sp.]
MSAPSIWFRLFWLAFISTSWFFLVWLGTHRSESPSVLHRYSLSYFVLLTVLFCLNVGVSILLKQRIYQHRRAILLLGVSVCVALITAEVFCRMADPLGISYFEETRRYNLDRVADPDLVVRHRRSWGAMYQGVDVRFNELGLRDDPIRSKKRSEYRILMLGDSVVFGWGVVQNEIFSVKLQQLLTTEVGRPIRVINAGVAGYNTVQEYTFLRNDGLALEPDLVLLLYHPNDIEATPPAPSSAQGVSAQEKSPPQVLELLLEQSWLYRLAVYAGRYGRYGIRSAADLDTDEFRLEDGWRDSMSSLGQMARLCKERHIPLVVFYVRLLATPFNDALLMDVAEAVAPLPVTDMLSWFAEEDKRVYMNSKMDPHLNPKGHQVIAEHMGKYLTRETGPQPTLQFFPSSVPLSRRRE